jgi:hypothetical protein
MKKQMILGVLFFSAIWGCVEAGLGGALYAAGAPYPSAVLTAIAFFILAVASVFLPYRGIGTAMGLLAMLYKFLNAPFFACHLVAIASLGVAWDVCFALGKRRVAERGLGSFLRTALLAGAACYLGHALFVGLMFFPFRSEGWLAKGPLGALRHVFVPGSLAAIGCALAAPLGLRAGAVLRGRASQPSLLGLQPRMVGLLTLTASVVLWGVGVAHKLMRG